MRNNAVAELFAKAAGRCSICNLELFEDNVRLGEMAHMIAKSKLGPRGELLFDGDLNSYENLILLCPNDHTRVDRDPKSYPIEELRRLKSAHEMRISALLTVSSKRQSDMAGLNVLMRHMPFTQIPGLVESLPDTFWLRLLEVHSTLDTFPIDNPHLRPFNDPGLEQRYMAFDATFRELMSVVDGNFQGSHGSNGSYWAPMSRDLEWQDRASARKKMVTAVAHLLPVYYELLSYMRVHFPEVQLSAYR